MLHKMLVEFPDRSWTRYELAKECELNTKHSLDRHVEILIKSKLLVAQKNRIRLDQSNSMFEPLQALLRTLALDVKDVPIPAARGGKKA